METLMKTSSGMDIDLRYEDRDKPACSTISPIDHLVTFRLGKQQFAFPLTVVERVLRMVALTPVPEAPTWFAGLMTAFGQVTPVVDLRRCFGLPPKPVHQDDRIVMVRTGRGTLGVMADEAGEVYEVRPGQLQIPEKGRIESNALIAVVRQNQEITLILDVSYLESDKGNPGSELMDILKERDSNAG